MSANENERIHLPPVDESKPPVAPERVTLLKASYRQTWFYFLLFICMMVAWSFPIRIAITRMLAFRPVPKGVRDAHEFVALAYEGISEKERDVSPLLFREHLDALREAGYIPIGLQDIRDFYREGKPLPRKAVLMSFDQARKSAYFDARGPLQRAGWNAVIFLWTKPIVTEDPASLRWPYVRTMLREGAWEVGVQGHDAFTRIVSDSAGGRRNFLTAPQWIEAENRYETPEEFSRRLINDHELARALVEERTQTQPLAFAFPYGDFGQYDQRALLSRRLNLDLVGRYYDLGFVLGNTALNTRHTDPRRLNRLLVHPDWSGAELVQRLAFAWPRAEGYRAETLMTNSVAWIADWGNVHLDDQGVHLQALPATTGAKAWISGTDLFKDFSVAFELRDVQGQFGLFLRSTPDSEDYVYLVFSAQGQAWLRQKHAGMQPFTLASARFRPDAEGAMHIQAFLRDNLVYARVNGQPLFQDIVTTRGHSRPGLVGCSVWDPLAGKARATIAGFSAAPSRSSAVTWDPQFSRERDLPLWLSSNAYRFNLLAPPWLRFTSRGVFEQFGWDATLFHSFARIYRMDYYPEIRVDGFEVLSQISGVQVAERAAALTGATGLLLNLEEVSRGLTISQLTTWIQQFSAALAERGLALLVRLPPALEQTATIPALFQSLPHLRLAAAEDSALINANGNGETEADTPQPVAVASAPLPYQDLELTLYYQLAGLSSEDESLTLETRAELLRQEGRNAFRSGEFRKALDIWQRWSELDTANEEPLSLVGDVHLRLGDTPSALDFYQRSLEINPGQVGLLVRYARLLDSNERGGEALELLNRYARIFPNNPDIALAQAEWLIRRNRRQEASRLIEKVLALYPENLQAMTSLHTLLDNPRARIENMRRIIAVGSRPGFEEHLARAVRDRDLFTLPESWMLMDFLETQAETAPPEKREQYADLLPRTDSAREDFRAGRLSSDWIGSADHEADAAGTLLVAADASQTEAFLRLRRSDGMHNGFIEALVDRPRGFLWLYARRGAGSMVRFGFDQGGQMYLQVWRGGQIVARETRYWTRPDHPVRLRLEVRGDGAIGFVDGEPAFNAPVAIPSDMGLGWWGIAPWAPQFGMAQVMIREIAGGPLPVRLGFFRGRETPLADEETLEALKPFSREISALAPPWYVQGLDGVVRPDYPTDPVNLRIFARYYRMRLLPVIRGALLRGLDLDALEQLALAERVDGFTLEVNQMPPEAAIREMCQQLVGRSFSLMLSYHNITDNVVTLRELNCGVGLFAGARRPRTLPAWDAYELPPEVDEAGEPTPRGDAVLFF
ncbi:MAG: tetratricopeptide repeat protein [Candidatus Marinimicrobia bacterium]|nr:tetratricopeptide repeat protein [Candidatus Neomarinimicrobiota bacterium]